MKLGCQATSKELLARRTKRPIALPAVRAIIMPITPFLDGERFNPETRRILGVALELTCIALRTGDCADDVKQAIADKLIVLAKTGERNPDVLCEEILKDIRGQQSDGGNNRNA